MKSFESQPKNTQENIPLPEIIADTPPAPPEEKVEVAPVPTNVEREKEDAAKLESIRETLGIPNPEQAPDQYERLKENFSHLSSELDEFEGSLRGNGFHSVSFDRKALDSLRSDNFEIRHTSEVFDDIARNLSKDIVPEDPRERMQIEVQNFSRVIDSIDTIDARLGKIRNELTESETPENSADVKLVSEDLSRATNATRRQREYLEKLRQMRADLE